MKLSSHEEYGLRCLLQVAHQGTNGSASIPEISRHEGISIAYVAKLMRILRLGGFVKAARGKTGGYTLALPPERIYIADALTILGGRLYEDDFCHRHSGTLTSCAHSTDCSIRSLWSAVQGAVDNILRKTTIRDLLRPDYDTVSSSALQGDLISLHGHPKGGHSSPISK
ncbi:MAG TPA: Rrf2 family transcriptional regulator [Bryobacteraceae bacterium]|nr:Rrf2 family transcriptional regulator [Bryobacteraceae bacterium]